MNTVHLDREGKDEEMRKTVRSVIKENNSDKGGGSDRYFWSGHSNSKGYVIKVAGNDERTFNMDVFERNVKILRKLGIDFPDTSGGVYDLSDLGYRRQTPVIMQEMLDKTYQQTIKDKAITDFTVKLFEGAIPMIDLAFDAGVELDSSLSNFGFIGKNVVYLDVQDGKSVRPDGPELERMYFHLRSGFGRVDTKGMEPKKMLAKESRFYRDLPEQHR